MQVSVYDATVRALRDAGVMETFHAQAALALAREIDGAVEQNGSAFSALVREHRMTMSAALADVEESSEEPTNAIDEIRRKRDEKRNSG